MCDLMRDRLLGDKPPPMVVASRSSREKPGDRMNRQFLAHTLSWQVSRDGQKIIGHMVLRKQPGSGSSSNIVGLKVVGGKLLEDGSMGAVIERVMEGSTADIEGQLRAGDEVIKWNGKSLQGKTFREVCDIIDEARPAPQVELVVSRNLSSTRRTGAQTQWRQKHPETIPAGPQPPHHKGLKKCILWELYDARREKPSVLVTSPGSPDLHAQGRGRHLRHPTGNANIGGNLQVKLSFDPLSLRLIVTLICAAGLMPRSTGQPRNPYAKIFLLPDKSEKSKRRTNTLANTNDPRWNQTFVYEGIRRPELRKRALEITVWDYGKCDMNDFLGEAVLELATARLDEEPEWLPLTDHGEHRHIGYYQEPDEMAITPVDCHLSPPSTTSRLSDSDTSECDITDCDVSREQRRTADGASISSIGSSSRFRDMSSNYKRHYSSPPPERELCVDGEHRSRRDMSPQGRKRALMIRDQPASISGYQTYRKDDIHRSMMGHRSHSAAPMDSPSLRYRGRSQSPTGHRSLSPPEHRSIPYSHGYVPPRFSSRSATATPTGSPKKRQLPLIPTALKERAAQDLQDRARFMRHRNRPVHNTYRSTGMGGWEKHYSGLSDSDLPSIDHDPLSLPHSHAYRMHRSRRGHSSPDKDVLGDLGDSDMESIASVTSSAFSTQSERPRGSRGLIPTVKNVLIPGVISPMPLPPRRNRRRHRLRVPCSECHCPNNNPTGTDTNTNTNTNTNAKLPRSNNPGKHNPTTPHPLVRSKSAVVRSLYRKMRTPFTRSQTVDENMLRYYSPETSEYSVSAGYILKPEELTGNSKKRIPEIYVEDCLKVDFNDRLVEKFRDRYSSPYLTSSTTMATAMTGARSGSARHSRSWLGARRSRRSVAKSRLEPSSFSRFSGTRDDRKSFKAADDLGIANLDVSSRPRRSFLFAKARSFDYDVLHDAYADRFDLGGMGNGLLSRRAKSFEYDTVSSNIFSDDSLRTARRKLKKNLAINDAGYGDKILALGDRSKSYFDSNGDDKLESKKARRLARTKNYDYHQPSKRRSTFYGYDSELSGAETEIYVPSFDDRFVESDVSLGNGYRRSSRRYELSEGNSFSSCSGDDQLGLRDVLGRSREEESAPKRITNLGSDMSDAANEHIYCSIDEALSSSQPRSYIASDSERYDVRRSAPRSRRKTKTTAAYPENGYDDYEWDNDVEYDDEGFVDRGRVDAYDRRPYDYDEERGDTRLYEDSNGDGDGYGYGYGYGGGDGGGGDDDNYYDGRREKKRSSRYVDVVDTTEFDGDGYRDYRSADEYDYRARSDSERVRADAYRDVNTLPRRRRRRRSKDTGIGIYENVQPYRDVSQIDPIVPTFASERAKRTMRLQRAESTPAVLRSDEELSSSERAERARRLYRRRRNASCPEARDLGRYDEESSSQRRRVDEERRSRFAPESDEEFGSMETVVCADCFRRRNVEADGRYYETERIRDVCPGVDSRCVECEAARTRDYYPCDREFARSGSLRAQYRGRRKSSCPECRELAMRELDRSGSLSRTGEDRRPSIESRHRYRRRNSSCPEARDLELQQRHREAHQHPAAGVDARSRQQRSQEERQQGDRGREREQQQQQQQQQQGSKRNVAISDTLEYYEYSMESESQCSENCGFGPCDPRRPRNRAPHPGNANSSLFDSQTATSDTAKNYHPRAVDHHDTSRNTKPSPRDNLDDETTTPSSPTSSSTHRRRSRKKTDDEPRDDRARDRRSSSVPESSEYSTGQSSSYEKTSRSQPPDSEHDDHNRRGQFTRSLSNTDAPQDEKVDGSLSDTAIGLNVEDSARRPRKSSPGSKSGSGSSSGGGSAVQYQSNLGKKSNSTSQLSATECGGICVGSGIAGLSSRKRNSTPSSIQRSEEIVPYQRFESGKQTGSVASDTAGSLNSISSSEGSSWSPSLRMTGETGQLRDFIEDLGPGQVVGRQALGARCLGEIQLSFTQKNRYLEVEVIRAKDLQPKQGSKAIPASYVKVYLVNGKKCIAKMKTVTARKTLDPFYQQSLAFREDYRGCILQVAVWGDYGRLEGKKVFMGIAHIVLDELNLNGIVFGWYKLFGNMPLVSGPSSLALSRRSSATSLESFKN
ncbi:uncharacterized protein LOC108622897 isoform X14 [Ceratina calcarata]|uniref:Uncharacterized protein LOC108622897 isoform X14 n=1 Tax=Ceratina calcarata TaxID=156304 RepID=A0AAJ7RYH8_9HYME|nr:uncharacterized protein LOC108622897 isoform X14 [Ceratina calcarata]